MVQFGGRRRAWLSFDLLLLLFSRLTCWLCRIESSCGPTERVACESFRRVVSYLVLNSRLPLESYDFDWQPEKLLTKTQGVADLLPNLSLSFSMTPNVSVCHKLFLYGLKCCSKINITIITGNNLVARSTSRLNFLSFFLVGYDHLATWRFEVHTGRQTR